MLLVSNNIIISQDKNITTINQNGLFQEKFMTYNVLNYNGDNNRETYFIEIIKSDTQTKKEFISFVSDNYSNLYGESSKDCMFNKTCFFYNPKYNVDGTVPKYFSNSSIGTLIEKYLQIFYELRAPQKFGMIVLPLFTLFPLFFRRFKIEKLFAFSSLLLIFPTLLTVEYGNRWNFTLLFLTSLIIEMTSSNIMYKQKFK